MIRPDHRYNVKMYQVSDEYQGDIEKAHWESQPIVEEEISFL